MKLEWQNANKNTHTQNSNDRLGDFFVCLSTQFSTNTSIFSIKQSKMNTVIKLLAANSILIAIYIHMHTHTTTKMPLTHTHHWTTKKCIRKNKWATCLNRCSIRIPDGMMSYRWIVSFCFFFMHIFAFRESWASECVIIELIRLFGEIFATPVIIWRMWPWNTFCPFQRNAWYMCLFILSWLREAHLTIHRFRFDGYHLQFHSIALYKIVYWRIFSRIEPTLYFFKVNK